MIRARSVLHHVEQKDVTSKGAAVLTTFIKAVSILNVMCVLCVCVCGVV